MNDKDFSQAPANNKLPILEVLQQYLKGKEHILEIGSGTGQHAVFFAEQFANTVWQTSDRSNNHNSINAWIKSSKQSNILSPLLLDVNDRAAWPSIKYDIVYTANTAHIMSWQEVQLMIELASVVLKPQGYFVLYGPFNKNYQFTSDSNKQFDAYLKAQDNKMGIRDFSAIEVEANKYGLALERVIEMPVNNMVLVFQKP